MKKIISIIMVLMVVSGFTQTNNEEEEYYNPNFKNWSNGLSMDTSKTKQNIKFGFSTGASVASGFNGGSGVNTWVAPQVLIPINNRFSVETGISYNKGFYNNYNPILFYGDNTYGNLNGEMTSVSYYVKGNYRVNERLTISGAVYGSKVLRTKPVNPANPNAFNFDNNGYSVGLNYKFSNGSELNFQLDLQKGNSPYYAMPYNGFGMGHSQFGNSFGAGFGTF